MGKKQSQNQGRILSIVRVFKVANVPHDENICKTNETVMYFSSSHSRPPAETPQGAGRTYSPLWNKFISQSHIYLVSQSITSSDYVK